MYIPDVWDGLSIAEYFATNPSSFCESSEKNLTHKRFVVEIKGDGVVWPQNLLSPILETQSPSMTLIKSSLHSLSAVAMFNLKLNKPFNGACTISFEYFPVSCEYPTNKNE